MRWRIVAAALVAGSVGLASCSLGRGGDNTYTARFSRAVQVFPAVKVRVLGVNVGEVVDVGNEEGGVRVTFRVQDDVKLPADVKAAIVPMSLLGERFIQLFPAYQGGPALPEGASIPVSRTAVPSEPDELLRSLQDYLGGLDPATVSRFVTNASQALEGSGEELNRLVEHGAGVIGTLANKRDALAGIIVELDKLTRALATRQEAIGRLIENYGAVVGTLTANRSALEGTIDGLNQAALQLSSLLGAHFDPLHADIEALTRTGRTLDRNAVSLALTTKWATRLFSAASRAVDYQRDWLRLSNQGQELEVLILMRLEERLMEICEDAGGQDCQFPFYWAEKVPSLFCFEPSMCPKHSRGGAKDGGGRGGGNGKRGDSRGDPGRELANAIAQTPGMNEAMASLAEANGQSIEELMGNLLALDGPTPSRWRLQ